ncbi:sensor histidine kinase [Lacihabitans soyangensis]|nr:HAMP domain-containing sensor histidine kinase [Lacihabitans soyangensis]
MTTITQVTLNQFLQSLNISVETVKFLLILNSLTFIAVFLIGIISFRRFIKIKNENINHENKLKVILHDLKSPITSYQGLAEVIAFLIRNKQFDKIEQISKQIDDYGSELQKVFLDLQRGASSQSTSPNFLEFTNLFYIINPIMQTYRYLANISGVGIVENYNLQKRIYTNPYLFQSILKNLLDNAVKNSTFGSSIELITTEKDDKCILSVINYPPDMSNHKIEDITNFLNAPKGITALPKKEMGLSIIKKYSELLGIKIIVQSDKQKVIFQLEIPTSPIKSQTTPNCSKFMGLYNKHFSLTIRGQYNIFLLTGAMLSYNF